MRRVCLVVVLLAALTGLGPGAAWGTDVFAGHSGWIWGNPLPQGHALRSLEFSGLRGYAAGDFGTLLRTDDGGATWQGVATGFTVDLRRVRVIAPDVVVIGGGCALRRSDDGGATFRRLPWTASDTRCSSPVSSFSFPSRTTGYLALQNGNLLRTLYSGRTWRRRTAVPGTAVTAAASKVAPRDVVFVTGDLGFAVTSAGTMFRTRDGGGTWEPVLAAGAALDALSFADAATGYAVGARSTLLRTTDGGRTWSARPVPVVAELTSIHCAVLTCLATTSRGDQVLRSADGGNTWSSVVPATERLVAAAPATPSRAVAVGIDGTVVLSDDGGALFSRIGGRVEGAFDRLQATSGGTAYAYGRSGSLARTTNGGRSWDDLGAATSDAVVSVSFPRPETGFALDAVGELLRTDNAGLSWRILNTGAATPPRAVLALDPRRVLLVGPTGIRRSTTGGQTFAPVPERSVRGAALDRIDRAGRALFASGSRVIFVSTSGGRRWTRVHRPAGSAIVKLDFVAPRTGFALLGDGRLMRTRDRGRAWTEVRALGTEVGTDIAFSDARHGYVTVAEFGDDDSGYVMATSDGGRNWRPQLVDSSALRRDALSAPSAASAFVLAGRDHLFATHRGGDLGSASRLTLSVARRAGSRTLREIRGRLRPARGGEQIVVSLRRAGSRAWLFATVTAASDGTFTVVDDVRTTTVYVAQWRGDDVHRGDGSRLLTVRVGRPPSR